MGVSPRIPMVRYKIIEFGQPHLGVVVPWASRWGNWLINELLNMEPCSNAVTTKFV
jgi:hypothetical protein